MKQYKVTLVVEYEFKVEASNENEVDFFMDEILEQEKFEGNMDYEYTVTEV